jgi:hypothetical protein
VLIPVNGPTPASAQAALPAGITRAALSPDFGPVVNDGGLRMPVAQFAGAAVTPAPVTPAAAPVYARKQDRH